MKTTVEIADELYEAAKDHARMTGRPVRALIEDGLRMALDAERRDVGFKLSDRSVGDPRGPNPLESLTWQDLRDEIYGGA